jgi:KUP system potassium uptake protein
MAQTAAHAGSQPLKRAKHNLVLGALGVVYGDIGTSPLYTVRQCFDAEGAITPESVLGVLSLIAWSLMMVVTVKYVIVILRADNRGEGGILALTALALRSASRRGRRHRLILMAGLVGAALF